MNLHQMHPQYRRLFRLRRLARMRGDRLAEATLTTQIRVLATTLPRAR